MLSTWCVVVRRTSFGPLRDWLRENVHRHGRKFAPRELLDRTVGGGLDPKPLLAYLTAKFGAIYGF